MLRQLLNFDIHVGNRVVETPTQPNTPNVYWRAYAYCSFARDDGEEPSVSISFERWAILRSTPKGAWIVPIQWRNHAGLAEKTKKFILNGARIKYAYPTKAEAWNSFKIRASRRRGYWNTEGLRLDAIEKAIKGYDPSALED